MEFNKWGYKVTVVWHLVGGPSLGLTGFVSRGDWHCENGWRVADRDIQNDVKKKKKKKKTGM